MSYECPYCAHEMSDPEEYITEGIQYEFECEECAKKFILEASYSVNYFSYKADCLNGAEHQYEPIIGPIEYCAGRKRCKDCGYETKETL